MKKINFPNKNSLEKIKELKKELDQIERPLVERIAYVYETIFTTTFKKKGGFCFYSVGAENGDNGGGIGDITKSISNEQVAFCIENYSSGSFSCLVILGNQEWDLLDGFPARWLYEDFEEELIIGKQLHQDKINQDKKSKEENKKLEKLNQKKMIENIKNKLTKDELDLLKII